MPEIQLYISGEDRVTEAVIERVLAFCSPMFSKFKSMPARGGEIKNKISELNNLSARKPVILLTDLDASTCAPQLKSDLLKGEVQNEDFIINVAVDEAEAWLMADTEGFSDYFGIPSSDLPTASLNKMGGSKALMEMSFPCKSSWMFTHKYIKKSNKEELRMQIEVNGTASKGKEYNQAVVPFIKYYWNIEAAMRNSDSLTRMVNRLRSLRDRLAPDDSQEV